MCVPELLGPHTSGKKGGEDRGANTARHKHPEDNANRAWGRRRRRRRASQLGGNTGRDRKGKPEGAKGRAKTQETGWNQDAGR